MAANFTVDGSWHTSEVSGGTTITPVQEFAIITKPSGVYFQFRRPETQLAKLSASARAALVASVADQLSTRIEAVRQHDNVIDVGYSQPTSPTGQLLDKLTIYVESSSGQSQGQFAIPMANVGPSQFGAIANEVDALDAVEGA